MPKKLLLIAFIAVLGLSLSQNMQAQVSKANLQQTLALLNKQDDSLHIINFWATWCKPCVKELPDLEILNKEIIGKKVSLHLVSLDDEGDFQLVQNFVTKRGLKAKFVHFNGNSIAQLVTDSQLDWDGVIPLTYIYNTKKGFKKTVLGSSSIEVFRKFVAKGL
jgi:thiol-disulfide isomerase/thioredoxin